MALLDRIQRLEATRTNKVESIELPYAQADMDIVVAYWKKNNCEFAMLPDPSMTAEQARLLEFLLFAIDEV